MATAKQTKAARQNVSKAQKAAASKQTIAHMPKRTRTADASRQPNGSAPIDESRAFVDGVCVAQQRANPIASRSGCVNVVRQGVGDIVGRLIRAQRIEREQQQRSGVSGVVPRSHSLRDAAIAEREDDDVVTQHHRIRPFVGR